MVFLFLEACPLKNLFSFSKSLWRVSLLGARAYEFAMDMNAGNEPSPSAVVVDYLSEDVLSVDRGDEGPVLPVLFNQIVAGEVGRDIARPEDENRLPGRPLTAFFSPQIRLPSCDVLLALQEAGLDGSSVACIQRKASGEILLTFLKADLKERFVRSSVLKVNRAPYAIQDVDLPLTFVQIFDAPHELPDSAIIQRLPDYCEVVTYRRSFFPDPGWEILQDGSRHYRVRMKKPIPSYMRFGKTFIQFRYVGQPKTCRLCHSVSHFANACHTIICFNCEKTGHLASDCPAPVACNICKATNHLAQKCPFSWTTISEIPPFNNVDNTRPVPSTNTPTDNNDSFEISQLSVGPATAHQLDQMESDATITLEEHQLTDKELSTASEDDDEDENFQDSAELFEPSTENLSPTPTPNPPLSNGCKPAKNIDSSAPTRIPTQPQLITGKGRELPDESDENTPLNAIVLGIRQTNTRNTVQRNLNGPGMFCLLLILLFAKVLFFLFRIIQTKFIYFKCPRFWCRQ